MDLASRKIELINWLSRQNEDMINKVESLRKSTLPYKSRMGEDLDTKLSRSEKDIAEGRVYRQNEVEKYFEDKFKK